MFTITLFKSLNESVSSFLVVILIDVKLVKLVRTARSLSVKWNSWCSMTSCLRCAKFTSWSTSFVWNSNKTKLDRLTKLKCVRAELVDISFKNKSNLAGAPFEEPLQIIEIQWGSKCIEEDIERKWIRKFAL